MLPKLFLYYDLSSFQKCVKCKSHVVENWMYFFHYMCLIGFSFQFKVTRKWNIVFSNITIFWMFRNLRKWTDKTWNSWTIEPFLTEIVITTLVTFKHYALLLFIFLNYCIFQKFSNNCSSIAAKSWLWCLAKLNKFQSR